MKMKRISSIAGLAGLAATAVLWGLPAAAADCGSTDDCRAPGAGQNAGRDGEGNANMFRWQFHNDWSDPQFHDKWPGRDFGRDRDDGGNTSSTGSGTTNRNSNPGGNDNLGSSGFGHVARTDPPPAGDAPPTSVPEPATLGLLGLGLAGLGFVRRRRR